MSDAACLASRLGPGGRSPTPHCNCGLAIADGDGHLCNVGHAWTSK